MSATMMPTMGQILVVIQLNFKNVFKNLIRDLQRRSSILQSARGRVATAAETVIASRLWSAMPVKHSKICAVLDIMRKLLEEPIFDVTK